MSRGAEYDTETVERSKDHARRALLVCDAAGSDEPTALTDLLVDLMHYFHGRIHPEADGETPLDGDDWLIDALDRALMHWTMERES